MKTIVFFTLVSLSVLGISSCDLFKTGEKSTVHYKSYFLGETDFQLSGKIYNARGQSISSGNIGSKSIANIYRLNTDWKIESHNKPIENNPAYSSSTNVKLRRLELF